MPATERDRQVFRNIADAESERRSPPASFADAVRALDEMLARHQRMFPDYRPKPDEDEFRSHEALYERARRLDARRR